MLAPNFQQGSAGILRASVKRCGICQDLSHKILTRWREPEDNIQSVLVAVDVL